MNSFFIEDLRWLLLCISFSSEMPFEAIQKEATFFMRITTVLTLHSLKEGDVMAFYEVYNVKVLLFSLYLFHVLEILIIEEYLSFILILVRDHSFSTYVKFYEKLRLIPPYTHTYVKFYEKLRFIPPDTHTYVCVSWGKKCWFLGNFCVFTTD